MGAAGRSLWTHAGGTWRRRWCDEEASDEDLLWQPEAEAGDLATAAAQAPSVEHEEERSVDADAEAKVEQEVNEAEEERSLLEEAAVRHLMWSAWPTAAWPRMTTSLTRPQSTNGRLLRMTIVLMTRRRLMRKLHLRHRRLLRSGLLRRSWAELLPRLQQAMDWRRRRRRRLMVMSMRLPRLALQRTMRPNCRW